MDSNITKKVKPRMRRMGNMWICWTEGALFSAPTRTEAYKLWKAMP